MIRPRHPEVVDHVVLSFSHGRGGGAAQCRDRLVAVAHQSEATLTGVNGLVSTLMTNSQVAPTQGGVSTDGGSVLPHYGVASLGPPNKHWFDRSGARSHFLGVSELCRLWCPLPCRPLSACVANHSRGHHRAACATSGVLGRRGFPLESCAARVIRVQDLDLFPGVRVDER